MASFRCYDSSDVITILIMTNFPLYLIQLWWQFFPNACLWRSSLCSNLAGIDPEKLSRATFICQYGLLCCMAVLSFQLFCKNLGNLQEFFGQMDYRPPCQKIARTPMVSMNKQQVTLLVVLDLSAAFDTVHHDILLRRLEYKFGIKDQAVTWFKSYLWNRSQRIVIGVQSQTVLI